MQRFQRYNDDGWFRVGQVECTTSILLSAAVAVSILLGVLSDELFTEPLVLNADLVRSGQVWRLVTWPFVNGPTIWTILSIAMLFLVGGDIERELGKRRFAWLIGALVVVPAIAGSLFPVLVVAGVTHIVSALFLVYVLWRPTARTFFEIPLWVFVAVFEVLHLLQILDARDSVPIGGLLTFWAVGLIVATLLTHAFGMTEFEQIPMVPLPQFVTGDPYQKANRARAKTQRKQQGSGRPSVRRQSKGPADVVPIRPEARLDRASQADMDALLDKISATGIDSLTPAERARLDDHSRKLRGN